MNIVLKNKYLYFDNYKLRCSIGKRGITNNKKEGDKKTLRGIFTFRSVFYRKDKLVNFKSSLKKRVIKKNMGWCDDPSSKFYNKLIKFPFKKKAERMWLKSNMYDVILVINYNLKPIIKNRGSAIFLHIAKREYLPTEGCVAVSKKDIFFLINKIKTKTKLIIS